MMKLITGAPGAGKTLRSVFLLLEAKKENDLLVKQGKSTTRKFYSNIQGLNLDFVEFAEADWRQYPDGSYIVYDEAHQLFPATGRSGRSDDEIVNQMDEHRHRGFDIIFLTQYPVKLHLECRQLITSHEHLHRSMGMQSCSISTWERVHTDPYDKDSKAIALDEIWSYPKNLFYKYQSSTLHTTAYKFKMPAKFKGFLLSIPIILIGIYCIYFVLDRYFLSKVPAFVEDADFTDQIKQADFTEVAKAGGEAMPQAATAPATNLNTDSNLLPPTGDYLWVNARSVLPISGYAASEHNCRLFDQNGFVMDIREEVCREIIKKPIPYNIKHEFSQSQSRGAGDTPAVTPLTSDSIPASDDLGPSGVRTEPFSVGPPADAVKGWIRSY
jgi:Zonular occludens toxin (Zot)